jgi:hypothetical protein
MRTFFVSGFHSVVIFPLKTGWGVGVLLWNLGDQIRQVYDRATPEEQRTADRRKSIKMISIFSSWCFFVLLKDFGFLNRFGFLGGKTRSGLR